MRILTLLAAPILALGLACAARADEAPAHVKAAAQAAPNGDVHALFIDVKGKVKWRANAQAAWQDAKVDDRLPVGGEVRTGLNGSRTTLRIGLNATVLIDSGSAFSIPMSVKDGDQLRTLAGLKSGRADFKIENTGLGADFKVATPSSVLAVRGTGFSVSYSTLKGAEIAGARTNAMRAIELRYALSNMPYFLSGQARSSLAVQNPVKHALLTAIGPPPLGGGQSEAEREQTLTQQQTGSSGSSPDSLQAQQTAQVTQSGRGDASSARQQYFIALEQSRLVQLELAQISQEFDQCSNEFAAVEQADDDMEAAMVDLGAARDRAVNGAAEGVTVSGEITTTRTDMLAKRDAAFVGFAQVTDVANGTRELTDAEIDALVVAVQSSTNLFGDRAARLIELRATVSQAAADTQAPVTAAGAAIDDYTAAVALLESIVPGIATRDGTIGEYRQIAQAALAAVQALYASTPSGEINATLGETLLELAAIAERAAQSAEFLEQAEEHLATSQSYAERLAISRAVELQQQAMDADAQMQLLLAAAGDLVAESALAQQAFLHLDEAIDAMVLSRANALASRTAAADAHGAIGTLFGNHALAVEVARDYISWRDNVAAADVSRIAAEGFRDTAVFNRDQAQTSYESVLSLAAQSQWDAAYQESLATTGYASAAGTAAAGAVQAAADANSFALGAAAAGGEVVLALNTPEGLAAYEADAAAALAAAGTEPTTLDPAGSGVLGSAGVAIEDAATALAHAHSAQLDAIDHVGEYETAGGDGVQPNNALAVLAGQIQNAIQDLEAASAQYTQLQSYAQTWAIHIAIDNIQMGLAQALSNAGSAAVAAEEAVAAAAQAQQYADDAATAAVPPGGSQP
ncbi:MAG: FecR domain-containing protein [Phycisphaerae bacterium]|nr:FecR domain-containing protein [Phycisphaerae bacterium]